MDRRSLHTATSYTDTAAGGKITQVTPWIDKMAHNTQAPSEAEPHICNKKKNNLQPTIIPGQQKPIYTSDYYLLF